MALKEGGCLSKKGGPNFQGRTKEKKSPTPRTAERSVRPVGLFNQSKMADLSAEAPLAPSEEFNEFSDFQAAEFNNGNDNGNMTTSNPPRNKALDNVKKMESSSNNMADHFGETSSSLSSSLEDLVNTFDDKITKCFRDLDQNVESLAPVQIRNQDDIINESQCVNDFQSTQVSLYFLCCKTYLYLSCP